MSTDVPSADPPPKKRGKPQAPAGSSGKGKRARKAEARAAAVSSFEDAGVLSSRDADRVRDRLGLEPPHDHDAAVLNPLTPGVLARTGKLNDHEKQRILEYLQMGFNRAAAVKECRIDYRRFRRQILTDPDFASDVTTTENSRIGYMEQVIFEAGMFKDLNAAVRYISNQGNYAEASFRRKLSAAEFELRKRVIDQQLRAAAAGNAASLPVDLSSLSLGEVDDFNGLADRVGRGEALDDVDLLRYAKYQQRIIQSSVKPPPPGLMNEVLSAPLAGTPGQESKDE